MASESFLTVDDQPISLAQALQYLQSSGKLNPFIADILRQHIIEQEIRATSDRTINSAQTEQAIIDFRLQNQLSDPQKFQEWLASNGSDYGAFHQRVAFSVQLTQLKSQVTESKLPEYFIERKISLDRIVLSRIVVAQPELAEELHSQIEEGASFEQLAKEYSLGDERILNGIMGAVSRGTLPDQIRAAIDSATPGELVGPIELEGHWCLFRVEQFLPASLEDAQLRQTLQNELFERWLSEKIQGLTVKLQIN